MSEGKPLLLWLKSALSTPVLFYFYSNKDSFLEKLKSTSKLIRPGLPAVYQLTTNIEKAGTLTRMTVGERKANSPNRTILLVGETGAGKSSFINALVNYAMGVRFEDGVWFQIVEEETNQTSDVMVYEICGFEGKTLSFTPTIIDTPGYGSIKGIEHDNAVSKDLLGLFQSERGVDELHAVGLMMKATDNRLSDRLMYILNSVMSLFGNGVEKNIVALITHSNGRTPKNALQALEAANVKCVKNEKEQPVYFLFNNCQHEDRAEEAEYLEQADKLSGTGMSRFTAFVEKSFPQKLETTTEVLRERIQLEACIQKLHERIKETEMKQREIQESQEGLKRHEEEMQNNKNFTVEVEEVKKVPENLIPKKWDFLNIFERALICKKCEENCHCPCKLTWSPEVCQVMKGGRCTVCTGKCPASNHEIVKYRYVDKKEKVTKTKKDLKDKYEKNESAFKEKSENLEYLEKKMKELSKEKSQLVDESIQYVVRLEEIALKADSVSTNVHLDFLIEKMKERGDIEKVQKLEDFKRKADDGTRAALRYKHVSENRFRCNKDSEHSDSSAVSSL